jgi:hypothetical protein
MLSGRNHSRRMTTDDLPMINIHRLRRQGVIRPGATTVMATIAGAKHTVPLAFRPGELGGEKVLFACPCCGHPRWHLYVSQDGLACRVCLKLDWVGHLQRSSSKISYIRRLRRRLGADPQPLSSLPARKGRRGWSVLWYDRLVAEIIQAEAVAINMLGVLNDQIQRLTDRDRRKRKRSRSAR